MKEAQTILSIDQGTTSSRAILFDIDGNALATSQQEFKQYYPQKGWVEHDPDDILNTVISCINNVFEQRPDAHKTCRATGITNQRETTILWDTRTGKTIYNAIVWQDRRTSKMCADLKNNGHEKIFTDKTGLLLDPYFSCTKIQWILDNVENARVNADAGYIAFGTVECFLLWHLTNGQSHFTDTTNAARTGLYNIKTQDWDDALLELFNVPRNILPSIKDNVADFGRTSLLDKNKDFPITGMAGDQHAAIVGQACFEKGNIKSTYGTGCFMLMNIGTEIKQSDNRLLITPAYKINGKMTYAIEGSVFIAGAAIQWVRDTLNIIQDARETEQLAHSVEDNNGVYFVPALTGLGAPHWAPEARGLITGLGRETQGAHIVRAGLEAQAYQTQDILLAMQKDTGVHPTALKIDGGLAENTFVCQHLADITRTHIDVPKITETTALGAAYLAGLGAGIYKDLDDIKMRWQKRQSYTPKLNEYCAGALYAEWTRALNATLSLSASENAE